MTKSEIRILMKNQRNELPKSIRNEYNANILSKLLNLNDYIECDMLFTYLSFGSEIDTIAIINNALKSNKKVYIPRVEGSYMNFYEIDDLNGLIRSKFGILEPEDNFKKKYIKPLSSEKNKLMLLPGLAFDKQGNRIGYGAGYYDKYLSQYNNDEFIKIGLSYDFQLLEHITKEQYDIGADFIVTPEKIYICKE